MGSDGRALASTSSAAFVARASAADCPDVRAVHSRSPESPSLCVRLCCAGTVSGSSSDAHSQRGTESSNPPPSSGKSTNHRFLGGGAASAVCHEPAPLYPELRPKVADFISWWIDPVSGRPIPERAGVLRYFVRIAEKIVWADRPEDSSRCTPRVRGGARSSDDGRAIRSSPDSPLEGTGFEPSVPREAASILLISVLVRADFSACRESSK